MNLERSKVALMLCLKLTLKKPLLCFQILPCIMSECCPHPVLHLAKPEQQQKANRLLISCPFPTCLLTLFLGWVEAPTPFAKLVQTVKIMGTVRIIISPFYSSLFSTCPQYYIRRKHKVWLWRGRFRIQTERSWLGKKEFGHLLACLAFWV